MKSILDRTLEFAKNISENSTHVKINPQHLNSFVFDVSAENSIYAMLHGTEIKTCYESFETICLKKLLDTSIQFCFWFYGSSIRPFECNSSMVSKIVDEGFETFNAFYNNQALRIAMKSKLRESRFTLLNERCDIWGELRNKRGSVEEFIQLVSQKKVEPALDYLVSSFNCFASDLFLKKAMLFFCELERVGAIEFEDSNKILIPADYQIPKVLEGLGILKYSDELKNSIENDIILPAVSKYEVEIRANTIIAIEQLKHLTGLSTSELDGYLFSIKNDPKFNKHHLTITTNY